MTSSQIPTSDSRTGLTLMLFDGSNATAFADWQDAADRIVERMGWDESANSYAAAHRILQCIWETPVFSTSRGECWSCRRPVPYDNAGWSFTLHDVAEAWGCPDHPILENPDVAALSTSQEST